MDITHVLKHTHRGYQDPAEDFCTAVRLPSTDTSSTREGSMPGLGRAVGPTQAREPSSADITASIHWGEVCDEHVVTNTSRGRSEGAGL